MRVHEKPSFRYVPSTFFAHIRQKIEPLKILRVRLGQLLRGAGQNVSREFGGGGETYCRVCSPKPHFWRPQKLGLVWSVPLSCKGNDRESAKKGGGKRIVGGGSKNVLGEGFYAEFPVCFPYLWPEGRSWNPRVGRPLSGPPCFPAPLKTDSPLEASEEPFLRGP